ncbi:MAG: hypothetical protein KJ621_09175 [Proteobacteria bacterium]|nr:hypothetical protein [Pseudomonadota bacterium]
MTDQIVTKRRMPPAARVGLIGACQVGPFSLQGGLLLLITRPAGPVRIPPVRRIEWLAPPRSRRVAADRRDQRTASPARKTIRVAPERAVEPSARAEAAPDQDQ